MRLRTIRRFIQQQCHEGSSVRLVWSVFEAVFAGFADLLLSLFNQSILRETD